MMKLMKKILWITMMSGCLNLKMMFYVLLSIMIDIVKQWKILLDFQ